jgi:cellulose synthase/poly-beta-1,6-N-acetylglucosamine synthase-like glycosyltransferase
MLDSALLIMAALLFLVTLPGTIELVLISLGGLMRSRPSHAAQADPANCRIAAIVPVHNEERSLARTVLSLKACDDAVPDCDICVIVSNSTDRSATIARQLGCTVLERDEPERRGKGYGLNYAFRHLAGRGYDAFVIVDADTLVERNFFNRFRKAFSGGADAAQAVVRVSNPDDNERTRLINIAFLAFTYLRPLARSRLGFSAGIFNGFGVSAKTVRDVPYECFSLTEDLEYHLQLVRACKRVQFLSDCSIYSEMAADGGEAAPQRARWEGGRFRLLAEKGPNLAVEFLRTRDPHRLEALLDLLLLPLAYQTMLLGFLALIGPGAFRLYAIFGLLLIVFHVGQAMYLGGSKAKDVKALAVVPKYIAWKIITLPSIAKASTKNAIWRRTQRSHAQGAK